MMKDAHDGVKSKLLFVIALVSFFICIEAIGAYISNSIAIFTDVLHLFSDLLGFVLSLVSIYYSSKKASKSQTFGYIRAEILGALSSVLIIWGMTIWIFIEAAYRFKRIINNEKVFIDPLYMLGTSLIGLFINIIMAFSLHDHGHGHGHSHSHSHGHDHTHDHEHEDGEKHSHDHSHDHDAEKNSHNKHQHSDTEKIKEELLEVKDEEK